MRDTYEAMCEECGKVTPHFDVDGVPVVAVNGDPQREVDGTLEVCAVCDHGTPAPGEWD